MLDPVSHSYDLARYAERIDYPGVLEPTLPVLHALAAAHARAIPFENLDVLLGRPVDLAPAALEEKLVFRRRGGYCFEQNGLMLGILRQVGFTVRGLSARVRLEVGRDVLPPRTHLFLVVTVEGEECLFDVGVGSFSLTSPLRFRSRAEQATLHEPRRIVEEDGRLFHQVRRGDVWADVYEFTGEEMPGIDREVANWWTSTNPDSKFRRNLMCARAGKNGERFAMLNGRLLHRRGAEVLSERVVRSAAELLDVLAETFGLEFPPGTEFPTLP